MAAIIATAIIVPVTIAQQQAAAEAQAQADAQAAAEHAAAMRANAFKVALASCGVSMTQTSPNISILDGGESLNLERVTKYDGISYSEMTCFLSKIEAPSSIEAEIGQTRALDGRQTDSWDGFDISWSYHPDDGASIVVKQK